MCNQGSLVVVDLCMQDYKSLCTAVTTCATLVVHCEPLWPWQVAETPGYFASTSDASTMQIWCSSAGSRDTDRLVFGLQRLLADVTVNCGDVQAAYFVFEKVKDELAGRAGAGDSADLKLRTMLPVPRSVTGRIIGRQGKNVREIQRMTGASVKLTDDNSAGDETTAEVYGNFMATQVYSLPLVHLRN